MKNPEDLENLEHKKVKKVYLALCLLAFASVGYFLTYFLRVNASFILH